VFVVITWWSRTRIEALQLLTPDRHGRVVDALVKALGGILRDQRWSASVVSVAPEICPIKWTHLISAAETSPQSERLT